jgi:hypothetical protein
MSYWITNTNGLLNQYLLVNASNFKVVRKLGQGDKKDHAPPLNFSLTIAALKFLEMIFDLNQKFTKYVLIDEIMVFYLRTHQTNFVKLYNKNKKYLKEQEFNDSVKI